jgi:hypothetical protein
MTPQPFRWAGDAMIPLRPKMADALFVIGETYTLVEHLERSHASHNHFFASVAEGWKNLPESVGERFPTPDALRKWALIKAGYRDERSIVCASKAEATRVAAFIKPMDDFAVVVASEAVVIVYTAKSQSMKAMGKEAFQASKQSVLDIIGDLIGVAPAQLENAEAGA